MKTIAFIFARGGSKGLPQKNIKKLCGLPLIAYSIQIAKEISEIDKIVVSTDDNEIATVAKEYGAEIPFMRPKYLAEDNSPEWLAWKHAVEWVIQNEGIFDIFVSLPATSPLRTAKDIKDCISLLTDDVDVVVTCKNAERNPYFNMITENHQGYVEILNKPRSKVFRRQDAPKIYDLTTVAYVTRPHFIITNNSLFDGRTKAVHIPKERAIDIDDQFDFAFAEMLMSSSYVKR